LLAPEAQVGELNICLEKGKQGQPTEQRSAMRDLVQCCVWFACLMNRIHKTHYPTPPVLGDFLGNHENRSPSKKKQIQTESIENGMLSGSNSLPTGFL
jgi:hypothetical protein